VLTLKQKRASVLLFRHTERRQERKALTACGCSSALFSPPCLHHRSGLTWCSIAAGAQAGAGWGWWIQSSSEVQSANARCLSLLLHLENLAAWDQLMACGNLFSPLPLLPSPSWRRSFILPWVSDFNPSMPWLSHLQNGYKQCVTKEACKMWLITSPFVLIFIFLSFYLWNDFTPHCLISLMRVAGETEDENRGGGTSSGLPPNLQCPFVVLGNANI